MTFDPAKPRAKYEIEHGFSVDVGAFLTLCPDMSASEIGALLKSAYTDMTLGRTPDLGRLTEAVRPMSRRLGARGHIPKHVRSAVLERDGLNCVYCGNDCADGYHLDHITPFSKGGEDTFENLCVCCPKCNLSKGAKTPKEWMS